MRFPQQFFCTIRFITSTLLFLHGFGLSMAQEYVTPASRQVAWQQLETTAFIHFTVNTYTGKEWGDGTESPEIFNPVDFDARTMVSQLKEAGFKLVILTAKHHDGFCLWPSTYTEHSVKNSPWKEGKGDIVKEFADACREYGLKFGFYLSPWDQNNSKYGTSEYNAFYMNQLRELLTNYGDIAEVWFDGAKGKEAKDMSYDFYGYWALVRELQPDAVMFSDAGPDVRWVGNEAGNAGMTCWSTIDTTGMAPGVADPSYLNTGDADGDLWIPAETDVSIRPGWFYHPEQDDEVRSVANLVNLYYQSVGRNSLLLLNIPPTPSGLFHPTDVERILEFRKVLDETFALNLLGKSGIDQLTDENLETYINLEENEPYVIDAGKEVTFDRILLQENIWNGQRIARVLVECWNGSGWNIIEETTTVGYKRLLRSGEITTSRIRVTVTESKGPVQLAEVGLFKASRGEKE